MKSLMIYWKKLKKRKFVYPKEDNDNIEYAPLKKEKHMVLFNFYYII